MKDTDDWIEISESAADRSHGLDPAGPATAPRQSVVKAAGGARRARLTPAPDTDPNPHPPVLREEGGVAPHVAGTAASRTANEAQLRQDRPPHW